MITWFDMPAEGLSPGSQAIIPTGKITITENATGIDVAQYATADVNVSGGGGGSSDFSTATVSITFKGSVQPLSIASGSYITAGCYINEWESLTESISFVIGDFGLPATDFGQMTQMSIPLYKDYPSNIYNLTYIGPDDGTYIINYSTINIVSGDAESGTNALLIGGNCVLELELEAA